MAESWQNYWRRLLGAAFLAGLTASGFAQTTTKQQRPALADKLREALGGGQQVPVRARDEDLRPLAEARRATPMTPGQAAQLRMQKKGAQPPTLPKPNAVVKKPVQTSQPAAETTPATPPQPTVFDHGTHLQIACTRPAMIFAPGDKFDVTVAPNEVEVYPDRPIHCRLQIFPTGSNQMLWTDEKTTQATKDGVINEVGPFTIPAPAAEGSYDLAILFNRQETGKAGLVAWSYVRKIQFAVVGAKPLAKKSTNEDAWRLSQEINLRGIAPPSGDESLLNLIPGLNPQQKKTPTAHSGPGKLSERKFLAGTVVEIPPGGWRAVPLTVRKVDQPHLVEIEYPDDQPQSAAVAVLEPNQTSGAGLALDHGWDSPAATTGAAKLQSHRFAFWPSSSSAVLLVANRDPQRPLAIAGVRVLAGGDELPATGPAPKRDERLVAACFDNFSLLDAFSARIALDEDNTPVADWKTWCDAGSRLTQYLRHAGFNGAALPIVHEGGALYPSEHFPTYVDPQRGIAIDGPKDLQEKDVVELLLQMFDREGLRLVTTVHFTSPLPELEELVQAGEPGILLETPPGTDADVTAPRYNPLHPQVQAAVAKVIAEIVARYGRHPAFAGVAIAWSDESYARLPGPLWGADELTLGQFFSDEQQQPPALNEGESPLVVFERSPQLRERWLKWRAAQLTGMYLRCGEEVAKADGPARLFLLGGKLLDTPSARAATDVSKTPDAAWTGERVLLDQGLDADLCRSQDRLTIVRPQSAADYPRVQPSLDELRPGETDRAIASAAADGFAAAFLEHPTKTFELQTKALDKTGLRTEQLTLVGQATPTGASYRRAWLDRIAAAEVDALFVGGPAPPFGREESVREFITVLRKLPAVPFETIAEGVDPLTARVARVGDKLYLTLANNSPWAATINIAFEGQVEAIENLEDGQRLGKTLERGKATFRRVLQPFSFTAVVVSGKDAQVGVCRTAVDARLADGLRREADSLKSVARGGTELKSVQNPGFETSGDVRAIPGWQLRSGEEVSSEIGAEAHAGKRALHITGNQEASIFGTAAVTAPFNRPAGRRFALRFQARTETPERDHSLRVLVEAGPSGGNVLASRDFGPDGQARRLAPLDAAWSLCEIPLDNLPDDVRQLRLRFVFRGSGGVWIDDVQLFDEGLSEAEQLALAETWTQFDESLANGRLGTANRWLRSAWPQYVKRLQGETTTSLAKRVEPAPAAAVTPASKTAPIVAPPVAPVKSALPAIADRKRVSAVISDEVAAEPEPTAAPVAVVEQPAPAIEAPPLPVPPTPPTPTPPPTTGNLSQLLRLPEVSQPLQLERDELEVPALNAADPPPVQTNLEARPKPTERKPVAKKPPTKEPAKPQASSSLSSWLGGSWLTTRKAEPTEKK